VMWVGVTKTTVAETPPNVTAAPGWKFIPARSTVVPPEFVPVFGVTEIRVGAKISGKLRSAVDAPPRLPNDRTTREAISRELNPPRPWPKNTLRSGDRFALRQPFFAKAAP
jgi:hypothetical protein